VHVWDLQLNVQPHYHETSCQGFFTAKAQKLMARCCAACPALRHLALNASFALPALKYAAAQGLRTLALSSYEDIFMRPLGRLTDLQELQLRGHRVRRLHHALQLPPNLTKLCFSHQARAKDWEEGTSFDNNLLKQVSACRVGRSDR
jgi:hypothetical protein